MRTEIILLTGAILLTPVIGALIWLAIYNALKPAPYGVKELLQVRTTLRRSKDKREWFSTFFLAILAIFLRRVAGPITALSLAAMIVFTFLSLFVPGIFGEDFKTARCIVYDVLISVNERMIDIAPTSCEYATAK